MFIKHIRELYNYRDLTWILALVEFKKRYKDSVLGYFWSLLEPLLMLGILYLVFSNLMKVEVEYYPLFLLQGIIMWNFFSRSTTAGLHAIINKPQLIKKIYFPREILIISECVTASLMSIFESLVFIAFLLAFKIQITINILYLPVVCIIFFFIALGVCLALAAMNVFYRDTQYIWAFVLQLGFFVTPIIYPLNIFPPMLTKLLSYNPIAQVIFIARDVTIYANEPNIPSLVYIFSIALVCILLGFFIFSKMEPKFAEEL